MNTLSQYPIIFYDAVCGLCDKSIQFVIKHDSKQHFRYAALQSDLAKQTLGNSITFDSFVLYKKGKIYYRSTAALHVVKQLGGLWSLAFIFIIIPPFIRNAVYDFVARNRYKWFGKFDTCKIPSAEQRKLFLD